MKKFIGRVKQLGDFKKSIFCMLDNRGHSPFPRLFLFSGEGGLGKSMLLDECIKTAEETVKEKGRKITVIKLDWDDYYYKNSPLPDDDTKMIKGLFTAFCDKVEKPATYFKDYIKKLEEVEKVNQKVAEKRKDFVPESKIVTEGLKFLAGANGIPVPGKAGDVFQEGLNSVLNFAYEHELKFREWLRKQGTLPEKDLTLYENANHDLSIALIKGLSELSEGCPVLLAVDTYERVDREKIEEWFRTLFLKKLLDAAPRMAVILSGRNNHYKAYRDQFSGEALYHVSLDEILFNTEEINEFTRAFGLDIKEADIKKLEQCTLGIPMVVEEVCYLLQAGKSLDDVLANFGSRSEQIKNIIEGVVDRFLKHCDNETRERVFHLAMLRQFDDKLLSAIWGLPVKEVNGILSTMAERHSFIQERRMHGKVREFIRVHLVNEIVSNRNSHIFEEFGKNIIAPLGARLDEIEKEAEPPEDRFTGEAFQVAFLDYINVLMWTDLERAFLTTRKHFLELLEFNPPVLFGVFHFMDELKPCFSAKQKKVFNILFTGFLENLFTGNFGNVHGKQELELLQYFEDNKKTLTDFQRRLLAYKWADFCSRSGKLDEAMTFLNKVPGLTTVSARIKEKITKIYSNLGRQYAMKKSYAPSLKCFNKAISLNPENAALYVDRGIAYGFQHDYDNALSDYNRAIELNPKSAEAYNNRGGTYYQKDYNKALSDLNRAIELNPDYSEAYNNRGGTYNAQKNYDKAISDLNKAIELNPDYAGAYNNRGNTYHAQKDYDKAIYDYTRAIELNPESAGAYHNRGITYSAQKDYDKAISDYTRAIELDPKFAEAYINRGGIYYAQKNYDTALSDLNRVIELNPEYADAYYNRGVTYYTQKDFKNALSDYTKAIEVNPKNPEAHYNRGIIFNDQKNYDKALFDYNKAIELKPEYAEAYNNRGNTYNSLKDYDKALSDYTRAIELKPEYADAYNNRGTTYNDQKNYDKAFSDFTRAIELNPEYALAFNNRGNAHYYQRLYDKALSDYSRAIALNPKLAEAYNNRGYTYNAQKVYDKAFSDFTRAIELNPDYAEAYNNRGNTYNELKNYDKALSDFNRAIELKPEYADAYNNRGNSHYYQRINDKALSDYNRAIELKPEYAEAYNNRGNTYNVKKDYVKALSDYNRAIDLNPEYAEAYNNRGTIYNAQKDYDKALSDFNKAIENLEDAEVYNNRGGIYYALKDYNKALSDYNKAIELNPEGSSSYLNLAELYILTNDFLKALETLHKASSLSLEVNDRAIMLYLENIAKKMTDADTMDCEKKFNQGLNEDFTITWSFNEFEDWLQCTPISEEKKAFINKKTDALKKHKV